ncbi:acyl-CoA thioesterase [Streptomyces sp. NPDC093223]|uniref:acyl-CoA thioesterase n=1 Tax=Streptomyces sp. NPDC093223 TaxID=3366033 RepID=UPI0038222ADB
MGNRARHQVQVRWPDVDGLGHVNHSAVLSLLEVGRDAVLGARGIPPHAYVVRRCEVDYVGELRPLGSYVDYVCDGLTLGNTSIRVSERLLGPGGRAAVSAVFTLVLWDRDARAARPLTAGERELMSDLEEEAWRTGTHALS